MKKRIISLMCTVIMILSAIFVAPSSAFAEETYDFSDSFRLSEGKTPIPKTALSTRLKAKK